MLCMINDVLFPWSTFKYSLGFCFLEIFPLRVVLHVRPQEAREVLLWVGLLVLGEDLVGPDGWQGHVPVELAEVGEADVLGVTPPERSGGHGGAVDGTDTVRQTVATALGYKEESDGELSAGETTDLLLRPGQPRGRSASARGRTCWCRHWGRTREYTHPPSWTCPASSYTRIYTRTGSTASTSPAGTRPGSSSSSCWARRPWWRRRRWCWRHSWRWGSRVQASRQIPGHCNITDHLKVINQSAQNYIYFRNRLTAPHYIFGQTFNKVFISLTTDLLEEWGKFRRRVDKGEEPLEIIPDCARRENVRMSVNDESQSSVFPWERSEKSKLSF